MVEGFKLKLFFLKLIFALDAHFILDYFSLAHVNTSVGYQGILINCLHPYHSCIKGI
jgi:hypothetical protein